MLTLAFNILAGGIVTAILLCWPRLAGPDRRRLALLSSGAGLVALILAMGAEGFRESPTVAVFLLGTPYVTERASASASLPYYVLTGVFLALGFAGLALGDREARAIGRRWLVTAVALSWLVTAARFLLDKAAAPGPWTQAVGVAWMPLPVGAFFALNLRAEGKGFPSLLAALVAYAYAVRGAVAALMVVATRFRLGSHYDVSQVVLVHNPLSGEAYAFEAGSLGQLLQLALVPQLLVWPLVTVLVGLLGAAVARVITIAWGEPPLPTGAAAEAAPAGQD